ncbi:MAG: FkbM family methyltransferase [Candidatus Omnitrophica bacterium]|nr:FkbM family methyltransferase [Candidatus Omnitrophota bacterium]MBU4478989.1 FkbM family methyltransferase [Candidatus Omnitrophota bacterium]
MPKILWYTRRLFTSKDSIYEAYNNIRIKIDNDTNFQWLNVVNYGGFEAVLLFEKYLRPGDIYIDIGANYGYMAINAKRLVGDKGVVIAIEPEPRALDLLKFNADMNNCKINIIQKVISNSEGESNFNVATETGLSRLDNSKNSTFGMILQEKIIVQKTTLDKVVTDLIPNKDVRLIKIDVEGHELKILQGVSQLITKRKTLFMLEINHGALSQNDVIFKDILEFFKTHFYKVFWIHSHSADWFRIGRYPTLEEVTDHKKFDNKYADIIAVPEELALQIGITQKRYPDKDTQYNESEIDSMVRS